MDEVQAGSLVRRWRLGKQLRELREAAGKPMDEAAEYIGVRRPTLSRIENGRHAILPRNVKFLCQLYDVGPPDVDMLIRQAEESSERGWWTSYSDTVPNWFETYVGFEGDAAAIWTYESELIPGLLQAPRYARAITELGSYAEADLERAVQFRLERQRSLRNAPPKMRVVLNESALCRTVGDTDVMIEQIEHLITASKASYLDLRVLPFTAGGHEAMKGAFSMLTLPGEASPTFVYLEHANGSLYLERPSDLALYAANFEKLITAALSASATKTMLANLKRQLTGLQEG
ncbi:MAG: helix-turn-helix domain-containing protein [Sciscionella sp.]